MEIKANIKGIILKVNTTKVECGCRKQQVFMIRSRGLYFSVGITASCSAT